MTARGWYLTQSGGWSKKVSCRGEYLNKNRKEEEQLNMVSMQGECFRQRKCMYQGLDMLVLTNRGAGVGWGEVL